MSKGMNWAKIASNARMTKRGVEGVRGGFGFTIVREVPRRKFKHKKKWKSDRVEAGQGASCPVCSATMQRYKHQSTPVPNGKLGYYEWWDICYNCDPRGHVKHRPEAWRSFPGRKFNPWKDRIETEVAELEKIAAQLGELFQSGRREVWAEEEAFAIGPIKPPW